MLYLEKGFLLIPSILPSRSLLLPRLAVARGLGLGLVLWALGRLVRDGGACTAGLGSGGDGAWLKSPVRVVGLNKKQLRTHGRHVTEITW